MSNERTYTSFSGDRQIASGKLEEMLTQSIQAMQGPEAQNLVIIDDTTGRQVDFDFRGTLEEVLRRNIPEKPSRKPGRPRLGVVSREISLLPRHWEWLAEQRGGASATLRRLVDEARRAETATDRARRAAAITGRAMTILAGDRENYEEAYRALDAGDRERFETLTATWPSELRGYLMSLAQEAFSPQ